MRDKPGTKPGTKMVHPEPCKELRAIPGWDFPSLTFIYQVLIVTQLPNEARNLVHTAAPEVGTHDDSRRGAGIVELVGGVQPE